MVNKRLKAFLYYFFLWVKEGRLKNKYDDKNNIFLLKTILKNLWSSNLFNNTDFNHEKLAFLLRLKIHSRRNLLRRAFTLKLIERMLNFHLLF